MSESIAGMFRDIPKDLCHGNIPAKPYTDDDFDNMRCYKIQVCSDSRLLELTTKMREMVNKESAYASASERSAYLLLVLACHLKSIKSGSSTNLFIHFLGKGGDTELSDVFKTALFQQSDKVESSGVKGKGKETGTSLFADGEESEKRKKLSSQDEVELTFGCFVAAYLFRMISKTAQNVTASWTNMKERFANFYSKPAPHGWKVPSEEWLNSIKRMINSDRLISNTWLKTFVPYEQMADAGDPNAGLVRYIAILPLAYTGLHAYKLFMEVRNVTEASDKWLLTEMRCPATLRGLQEIEKILTEFEPTTTASKSPKFKYARLVSPSFFLPLQTKSCRELVYLLICILKEYKPSANANQDPEKIEGIKSLPPELRAMFQKFAEILVMEAKTT